MWLCGGVFILFSVPLGFVLEDESSSLYSLSWLVIPLPQPLEYLGLQVCST